MKVKSDNYGNTEYQVPVGRYISVTLVLFMLTFGGCAAGCPRYKVWQQGLEGQAELARAVQNRQIAIQEAQAKKEAAKELAQAEIERARGVAEANRIIGQGLKGHEEYLRYLWIMSLEHAAQSGKQTIVYVPTEANLPILEAGRSKEAK